MSFPIPERARAELVTKTGKVLTDEDIQQLADEAERGYDPASFQPRHAVAAAARDEGMTRADVAADSRWKTEALSAIYRTAQSRPEFISDDVWLLSGLHEPKEARALGPLFREAARRGWIVKTDRTRPSVRSNLSGKPVWRSLLFGGGTR